MPNKVKVEANTASLAEHKLEDVLISKKGLDSGVSIKIPSLERRVRDSLYEVYAFFKLGRNFSFKEPKYHYISYKDGNGKEPQLLSSSELAKLDRTNKVRVVCISDTHERHESVTIPPCDVFIHTGDILFVSRKKSLHCNLKKMEAFNLWLGALPATHKVVVAGNHDIPLEVLPRAHVTKLLSSAVYLCNQAVVVEGLRLFGTPYSSGRSANRAFQSKHYLQEARQELLKLHKSGSPVDLLLSHSDDMNPLDIAASSGSGASSSGSGSNSDDGNGTQTIARMLPKVHVWGHHHNKQGSQWLQQAQQSVLSACAVIMTAEYEPVHPAMVIDFERRAVRMSE